MSKLLFARINSQAKGPTREGNDLGYDCYAFGDHILNPGETKIIPLGFMAALPSNHGAFVWDRSSFGSKGIHVFRQLITNPDLAAEVFGVVPFGGVIEGDYRGQWGAVMHNMTSKVMTFNHQQKVVQFVIQECMQWPIEEITLEAFEKIPSIRAARGFGCSDGQNTIESAQNAIRDAKTDAAMKTAESAIASAQTAVNVVSHQKDDFNMKPGGMKKA